VHKRDPEERIFPIATLFVIFVVTLGSGFSYWYYGSQAHGPSKQQSSVSRDVAELGVVYGQLGIQPLPSVVERQPAVQARLEQLAREVCYTDAVVGLGKALLSAGYPREAVTSLRSFARRCGNARQVLPLAYLGLQQIGDFSGSLDVANDLVGAAPEERTFRYWRAIAHEKTSDYRNALTDYLDSIQLIDDLKKVDANSFYSVSRMYAALGKPCDAITPLETYISLGPASRRTPQLEKLITDYAKAGDCDTLYASGTGRVTFTSASQVRALTVAVNGIVGHFILDTGSTFVAVTSQFASRAGISLEEGQRITMKTVGGSAAADIGYANSVRVGDARASRVVVAVHRGEDNPFGAQFDGLLGMSFLSRFNLNISATQIELHAISLR
jgi:aspartyl protease family protein